MTATPDEATRDDKSPIQVLVLLPDATSAGGGVRVAGELLREWTATGVRCESLSLTMSTSIGREVLNSAPHDSLNTTSLMRHIFALRTRLLATEPDGSIVLAIGDYSSVVAQISRWFIPPGRKPKIVNAMHQPRRFELAIAESGRFWAIRRFATGALRLFRRSVDGYIFLSDVQMELYRDYGVPSKVPQQVIKNPVRFPAVSMSELKARKVRQQLEASVRLVSIGALNTQKNHRLLLDAVSRLDGRFTLSIAGSGRAKESLLQFVSAHGLSQRVVLLGHCNDVKSVLDNHDVLVVSSTYEASPLVFLEAIVRGLPVVSTDCAPNCQQLASLHASFSVTPLDDASALAASISNIADHAPGSETLLRAAQLVANAHSPSSCAAEHITFFRGLLKSSKL